jgi:hypothetical protein
LACAAVLSVIVVQTEHATARPDGVELIGAVVWRGIVYGITDGMLLSEIPILAVFAALAGRALARWRWDRVAVGAAALLASLVMTAVYHAGYGDLRSDKMRKPLTGDLVWSLPRLTTLNPIGAPIAHVGLHVSAVLHSYETDTFLSPHD